MPFGKVTGFTMRIYIKLHALFMPICMDYGFSLLYSD